MKLISKLNYQARIKGLDVEQYDGIKLINTVNKKYVHILPTGKICTDDILGHDAGLKDLMPQKFIIKDPLLFSGSFLCLPCNVTLHVGREISQVAIDFAKNCLNQSFANINVFDVVVDNDLLQHECRITQEFVLSYKERQTLIKAFLEYLI